MAADHTDPDEPMVREDGHRYAAPESREETRSKSWDYAVLGLVVVVLMVLIATGVVPIFDL